ncbi:hypothetical protein EPN15_03375 [Patescibacteria group bacterium]|nr:MAG: hypothetical protein EPN15_03375 [Patescibacteria group bacterium]
MSKRLFGTASHLLKMLAITPFWLFIVLSFFVLPLSAFEAHVINVTATIDPGPKICDARSLGYWKNHEGCAWGEGESIWESAVQSLSTEFSGIFSAATGEQMCYDLWLTNCKGTSLQKKRCRARVHTLAVELNVVSGRLDLDALIAGADNGNSAFDHLGLTQNSTIRESLAAIEAIIANNNSTASQYTDAAYAAERIYEFYENECAEKPYCIYGFE